MVADSFSANRALGISENKTNCLRTEHALREVLLLKQDLGDPAVEASPRDIMYTLEAANASAEPQKLAETDLRCTYSQCEGVRCLAQAGSAQLLTLEDSGQA